MTAPLVSRVGRSHPQDDASMEQGKFQKQVKRAEKAALKGRVEVVRSIARIAGRDDFPEGEKFILDRSLAKAMRHRESIRKVKRAISSKDR